MSQAPVLFSPRVYTRPEFCERVLLAYEECVDTATVAAKLGRHVSATSVLACLNQMGLHLSRGGKGLNRLDRFRQDNPPERLAAIHAKLMAIKLHYLFLREQGELAEAWVNECQKRIRYQPFMGAALCSPADYRLTLVICLRTGDQGHQAAAELGLDLRGLHARLRDMFIEPARLVNPGDHVMVRHVAALQTYLAVVEQIETGPPA